MTPGVDSTLLNVLPKMTCNMLCNMLWTSWAVHLWAKGAVVYYREGGSGNFDLRFQKNFDPPPFRDAKKNVTPPFQPTL